jgi:hypothetical protein
MIIRGLLQKNIIKLFCIEKAYLRPNFIIGLISLDLENFLYDEMSIETYLDNIITVDNIFIKIIKQ